MCRVIEDIAGSGIDGDGAGIGGRVRSLSGGCQSGNLFFSQDLILALHAIAAFRTFAPVDRLTP